MDQTRIGWAALALAVLVSVGVYVWPFDIGSANVVLASVLVSALALTFLMTVGVDFAVSE